jgi:hypothetical protein
MGNFFTNLQIRATDKAEVENALKQALTASCYVSRSSNGWVSAYPKESEGSHFVPLKGIAKNVSRSLKTDVLCFLGYDDEIFVFSLYASGNLVGHYDSQLQAFGGSGQGFDSDQDASRPITVAALMPLRRDGVTEAGLNVYIAPTRRCGFDVGEIMSFAELLGIPGDRAVEGYNYVEEEGTDLDHEAEEITLLEIS